MKYFQHEKRNFVSPSGHLMFYYLFYYINTNEIPNQLPISTDKNHSSAISYADHMQHYVTTELRYHAIARPFCNNPFPQPLICCPLQTVPKRGSSKRRVVMDLSSPPHASVNIGIPDSSYLNEPYKFRLPRIDRLCEFFLQLGPGCLLYKLDLQRAYRQNTHRSQRLSSAGISFQQPSLL